MSTLKMFEFTVTNTRTKEQAAFLGQGTTLEEAWKDGWTIVNGTFRPNSNGQTTSGKGQPLTMGVLLPDGRRVSRLVKDFQGDEPYRDPSKLTDPVKNLES